MRRRELSRAGGVWRAGSGAQDGQGRPLGDSEV